MNKQNVNSHGSVVEVITSLRASGVGYCTLTFRGEGSNVGGALVAAASAAVSAVNTEPGPLGGLDRKSIPDDAEREAALRQRVLEMEQQLQVRVATGVQQM